MEIAEARYKRIRPALPVQRSNVSLSLTRLRLLNTPLYVPEHGYVWHAQYG